MSINSNKKGKKGELEFANLLKEHGFDEARRSQQYAGINNDADVVGLDGFHIEVKRVERLNLIEAYQQAVRDKRESEIAIVAHRKNYKEWKITLSLEDWLKINQSNDYYIHYTDTTRFSLERHVEKAEEVSKATGLKASILNQGLITVRFEDFITEIKERWRNEKTETN